MVRVWRQLRIGEVVELRKHQTLLRVVGVVVGLIDSCLFRAIQLRLTRCKHNFEIDFIQNLQSPLMQII